MFVFGGYTTSHTRQILVVDQCELTKKGELPFEMTRGACAQRDNREVFICFEDVWDESTSKNCHRSTGPLEVFSKLPDSTYDHRQTRIAVTSGKAGHCWIYSDNQKIQLKFWESEKSENFSDYLIAVGSWLQSNVKTELLSKSNSWSTQSDYPGTEYFKGELVNWYRDDVFHITFSRNLMVIFDFPINSKLLSVSRGDREKSKGLTSSFYSRAGRLRVPPG